MQAANAADGWQCATIGIGTAPALAQSAASYLERAGRIYPSQLLGVVSAGGRVYLVNANDGGWSERVRQGLLELRLAEPDITAARRFHATASGTADVEIPAGDHVCLVRDRAARHGLALSERGEAYLASGRSVHLVDPNEGAIVVEVRAVGKEPLAFRDILALSGRSGIYAGLAGRKPQPETAAEHKAAVPVAVAVGPAGRPDGEVIITARTEDAPTRLESAAIAAVLPESTPVAPSPAMAASPSAEEVPASIAKTVDPTPPATPARQEIAVVVAAIEPVPIGALAPPASPQPIHAPAEQSYEDYSKMMRGLMAQRRVGGVRSMSEMTYVHPAVETLRTLR